MHFDSVVLIRNVSVLLQHIDILICLVSFKNICYQSSVKLLRNWQLLTSFWIVNILTDEKSETLVLSLDNCNSEGHYGKSRAKRVFKILLIEHFGVQLSGSNKKRL